MIRLGELRLDLNVFKAMGLVNPLHDACNDLVGAKLKAVYQTPLQQCLHGSLPLHRRCHLARNEQNDFRQQPKYKKCTHCRHST